MHEIRITSNGIPRTLALCDGVRWRIGRAGHCEIKVTDPFVSTEHAEITLSGAIFRLRRTQGSNPILIDKLPVEERELRVGDAFSIGQTRFELCAALQEMSGTRLIDTCAVLGSQTVSQPDTGTEPPPLPDAPNSVAVPAQSWATSSVRLLEQLSGLLQRGSQPRALGEECLKLACARLNAGRGFLARVGAESRLEVLAQFGFAEDVPIEGLISQSVLRRMLDERQSLLIHDTTQNAGLNPQGSIERNKIRAVACAPILSECGAVEAVIYVDGTERQEEFGARDAEFLIWTGQLYRLLSDNLEMRRRLEAQIVELKRGAAQSRLIAESPAMLALLERTGKAAASEASVLILGETGSGKECLARYLHDQSPRSAKAYAARNCAAIPEDLFESEMFGHVKGAFTGASQDRKGAFREAEGGTLFLDEIGDLNYALQSKLLRAIQERKVRPVGSDRDIDVNVRLVAATNKELRSAIRKKDFREDLFYRIATVTVQIPPLRERKPDILPLARHFVEVFSAGARRMSTEAEAVMIAYAWPGNVRELRACIEQAVIFAVGGEIQPDELNLAKVSQVVDLTPGALVPLAQAERQHILRVLHVTNNNKNETARVLGIARSTLSLKLKEYGIG